MKKIFIGMLVLSITSCGAGISDLKKDVGKGYYYVGAGSTKKQIVYIKKKSVDMIIVAPTVQAYDFNDDFIIARQQNCKKEKSYSLSNELSSISMAFKFLDNKQIIDKDKYYKEAIENNLADSLFYRYLNGRISDNNTVEDQQFLIKIADSLIDNAPKYSGFVDGEVSYWVIDKKKSNIYGPLEKQKYFELRNKLRIPESLSLTY